MTGVGYSMIRGNPMSKLDEYRAIPTEKTGRLGSWGDYKLEPLVIYEDHDPRVIRLKDPQIIVHFAEHSCFTYSGEVCIMRKSLAKYGNL